MPGPIRAPARQLSPLVTGAAVFTCALLLVVLAAALPRIVYAQSLNSSTGTDATTTISAGTTTATGIPPKPMKAASGTAAHPAASSRAAPRDSTSKPAWTDLTPSQQQALQPLAASWGSISEAQKRKWLVLSKNYPSLPAEEQAKLRGRMTEWVALSSAQRTQARLNFAETKKLSPVDKKAKWQAYQALPPEEKKKLAAGAQAKPPATAAAVKPVAPQKMAKVPQSPEKTPRIATAPHEVDHNTLLPQPVPAPVLPVVRSN